MDKTDKMSAQLKAAIDDRTPLEKLIDNLAAARLAFYRPAADPAQRRDVLCLCCGNLYRPDDVLDGENVFVCISCISERKQPADGEYRG